MKQIMKKLTAFVISVILVITCMVMPISALADAGAINKSSNDVKMTFVAWGDPQVSNAMSSRGKNVEAASKDLKNAKCKIDALVLAGDITENAFPNEYTMVHNYLKGTGVANFITSAGNHDIRLGKYDDAKSKFVSFTNKLNASVGSSLKISKLNYSYTVNGCRFIVLGSEKTHLEESIISDSQLNWLDSQLKPASSSGKPTFVVMHQPLKNTHGLPNTWGSSNESAGTVGEQSDDIKNILNKYKNVILITGHLHTGFGKYSYQKIGNFHSVNLPSVGIDNEDGYAGSGQGYVTEVFANKVVFRARNFITGEYLPKYNITINLNRVKSIKLSASEFEYNAKVKTPSVSLYNYSGNKIASSSYTVTYPSGRKNVGTYKIKITFKNAYAGNPAQYVSFVINPKSTGVSGVTAKSKGFTVKWYKRTEQVTGYQVQYATSNKFTNAKSVTVSGTATTSKSITKLSANKKYFVRVRTYKTVNGKKYYSKWSGYKTVTTK